MWRLAHLCHKPDVVGVGTGGVVYYLADMVRCGRPTDCSVNAVIDHGGETGRQHAILP